MKMVVLFVIGVLGGGCATTAQHLSTSGAHAAGAVPATLADLRARCVSERGRAMRREWSRYEMRHNVYVYFPNWRGEAHRWARHECAYGRPIADFHPWHLRR